MTYVIIIVYACLMCMPSDLILFALMCVQLYLKKLLNFLSSLTVCVNRCSISKNIHFIFILRYQRPVSVTLNPTCLSKTAEVYFFFHMSCLRTQTLFLFFSPLLHRAIKIFYRTIKIIHVMHKQYLDLYIKGESRPVVSSS